MVNRLTKRFTDAACSGSFKHDRLSKALYWSGHSRFHE